MAKQVGPLFVTGTIDGIIFYKLNGKYYMRSKGDYKSGKMMRKDPRLKRTMQNPDRFGVASRMVKKVYYRHLPNEVCKPGLFGQLTGMVNKWLYQGKTREEAQELLLAYLQTLVPKKVTEVATPAPSSAKQVPATVKEKTIIPAGNQQPVTVAHNREVKKARYLSHWKVKRCGRLQMPKKYISKNCAIVNMSFPANQNIVQQPIANYLKPISLHLLQDKVLTE